MKKIRCTFCGSTNVVGYLLDRITLRICGGCRDSSLSFLKHIGVTMSEEHVFVRELCVYSHYLESAWWTYYDQVNQTQGVVQKSLRPDKRPGLKRIKSGYVGQKDFFMMRDIGSED